MITPCHAKLAAPFAVLGIRTLNERLAGIEFLPPDSAPLAPQTPLAREVCRQLQAYFRHPDFIFDLPLELDGSDFRRRVWRALMAIPSGGTLSYGELARRVGSAPRAVGQACGANPVAIVVPCHRVLARRGLGGFMNAAGGEPLAIKRWLLQHEAG